MILPKSQTRTGVNIEYSCQSGFATWSQVVNIGVNIWDLGLDHVVNIGVNIGINTYLRCPFKATLTMPFKGSQKYKVLMLLSYTLKNL